MKKITKIVSAVLTGVMLVSATPAISVSAATVSKPTKVKASNVSKGVKITWGKAKGAKKYVVMRKLSATQKYIAIKTLNSTKTSFVDKTAKAGKTYKYTVKAVNGEQSAMSYPVTVVRLNTVKLNNKTDKWSIRFKWSKIKGAKAYEVYRAEVKNGKTTKFVLVSTSDWNGYYDWSASNGVYKYKVRAINGKSKGEFSKVLKIDFIMSPDVYASVNNDRTGVVLNWDEVQDVDKYEVYRSEEKGKLGELLAIVTPDQYIVDEYFDDYKYYEYIDTKDLQDNKKYYYTVIAYDGNRTSKDKTNIKYSSADYVLTEGEVYTEFAEEMALVEEMYQEMGAVYSISFTSEDESIAKVDENNNLVAGEAGKVNIIVSMTVSYVDSDYGQATTVTSSSKMIVLVLPTETSEEVNTPENAETTE